MSLRKKLQDDWIAAMKSKDKFRAGVITMAKAALLKEEKDSKVAEIDDQTAITIISREIKQRRESVIEFEKGKRQDLVDQTKKEIEILLEYLPQQLTNEEVTEIIKTAVKEVGATGMKDMGKVMSAIMPKVKGKADGKVVSDIVKQQLNK